MIHKLPLCTISTVLLSCLTPVHADEALDTQLFHAIRQGDVQSVASYLDARPAQVEARDQRGWTPLMLASFYAGADCVEALLARGANVQATNDFGAQALLYATWDLRSVKLLVEAGADVNHASQLGNTSLFTAARNAGSLKVVRYLIEHGANVNDNAAFGVTPLMIAADAGNLATVRLLLAQGANPNAKTSSDRNITVEGQIVRSPLFGEEHSAMRQAAASGHLEIMQDLVASGGDVDEVVLNATLWENHVDVVRFLLDQGAKTDNLILAAINDFGDDTIARMLMRHGADPNTPFSPPMDGFGQLMGQDQFPLVLARRRGHTQLVQTLLDAGAIEHVDPWAEKKREPPNRSITPQSYQSLDVVHAIDHAAPLLTKTIVDGWDVSRQHNPFGHGCLSCHNQLLPMIALSEAKNHGIRLNPKTIQAAVKVIQQGYRPIESQVEAEITLDSSPANSNGLLIWAMSNVGIDSNFRYDAVVNTVAQYQKREGDWQAISARPPMVDGNITPTALGILTLSRYPLPGRKHDFTQRIAKATQWLKKAQPRLTEEFAFKLLGMSWAGTAVGERSSTTVNLLSQQNDDGGWSSSPQLGSDAYATGQAIFALIRAAQLDRNHPAVRRGVAFLLKSQLADGSWFMRRRAIPFQPTMDPVFPHGRDAWISAAATSWAVLGLTAAVDTAAIQQQPHAAYKPQQVTTKPLLLPPPSTYDVDFQRDIDPILQSSCIGCHNSADKAGGYEMESRVGLIKGGVGGPPVVIPGNSANSLLIHHVSDMIEDVEMPPRSHREDYAELTDEEIGQLRAWIDQGLPGISDETR